MITIIGDLHFDAPGRYEVKGENLYLSRLSNVLENIIEESTGRVIFLGDIFEKKDKIENKVKNKLVDILTYGLEEKELEYVFITGNHDIDSRGELSIKWLSRYGEVICGRIAERRYGNVRLLMIPWGMHTLPGIDEKYIILGHMKLKGVEVANGIIENGDDCYDVKDILRRFAKGSLVVNGHYHKFGIHDGCIMLGSLVSVDFGDLASSRYVLVIDEEKGESKLEEIPNVVERAIVRIESDSDVKNLSNLSGKFVRFDVITNVNVEKLREKLDSMDMAWYDINFISDRKGDISFEKDERFYGVKEFIKMVLETEIEPEKKNLYERVIREKIS